MGTELADMTKRVLQTLEFSTAAQLDWRLRRIPLDYRDVPAERRDEVDRILADSPTPKWQTEARDRIDPKWFQAASTRSIDCCRARSPQFLYEVQAFRVGDTAFVGLPGEPFCEGQLEIKLRSPAAFTFVAHMTAQYVGYVPTEAACARPGHESNDRCTFWAKLAPDSLGRIVDAAVELLREMFS
jgi:hypothetical protein